MQVDCLANRLNLVDIRVPLSSCIFTGCPNKQPPVGPTTPCIGHAAHRTVQTMDAAGIVVEYRDTTIDRNAAKMNAHRRLPAMSPPQQDTQGRQVIDWFAQHQAIVKELETAHAYLTELHKEIGQLRSQVTTIEHHLKDELR